MPVLNFDQLFEAYSKNYSNELLTERQLKHLKLMHEQVYSSDNIYSMTLSQSDLWFKQAHVLQKKVLSLTDTGMCYSKFKKFALTKKDYIKFLRQLSDQKQVDNDKLMEQLLNAGLPEIPTKPRKLNQIPQHITQDTVLEGALTLEEPITEIN
ncbi:unnamed protein product [Diamesa serratosioi]